MALKLVVFEGIAGSGKTTQQSLLRRYLETLGEHVIEIRLPSTENKIGCLLVEMLCAQSVNEWKRTKAKEAMLSRLFTIDNIEEHERILSIDTKDAWILQSRGPLSTLVYQKAMSEEDRKSLLYSVRAHMIRPTVTFLLQCRTSVAFHRKGNKFPKAFEEHDMLQEAAKEYDRLTIGTELEHEWNICRRDANARTEIVHADIVNALATLQLTKNLSIGLDEQ